MKPSIIKSKDELPMFMSVMDLIDLLGISRSSAYELAAEEGFPKLKLVPGRVIIPRDRLLEWLEDHTSYMVRGAVHAKSQRQAHLQKRIRQDTRGMRGKAR